MHYATDTWMSNKKVHVVSSKFGCNATTLKGVYKVMLSGRILRSGIITERESPKKI